jgi:hypothetical protein
MATVNAQDLQIYKKKPLENAFTDTVIENIAFKH